MVMRDFPEADPYTVEVVANILTVGVANIVPYAFVQLSNPEAGIDEADDPNATYTATHAAAYWTSSSPNGYRYQALRFGDAEQVQLGAEMSKMRNLVLGASVGALALERRSNERAAMVQELTDTLNGGIGIPVVMNVCDRARVPLGLVVLSTVESSSILEEGAPKAQLWYPEMAHPKPVLAQMKKALRDEIKAETT